MPMIADIDLLDAHRAGGECHTSPENDPMWIEIRNEGGLPAKC